MTETTVIETATTILSTLNEEYHPGYMPYMHQWCNFVIDYSPEKATSIPGVFDRIIPKVRRHSFRQNYFLSDFSIECRHRFGMTQDCLRMLTMDYHPYYCVRCGDLHVVAENSYNLCDKCFSSTVQKCRLCGGYTSFDDDTLEALPGMQAGKFMRVQGKEMIVCKKCSRDKGRFIKCDCCGNTVSKHDIGFGKVITKGIHTGEQLLYCKACVNDGSVILCPSCNKYVLKSEIIDESSQCVTCHIRRVSSKKKAEIHSHSYRPKLVFISTTPMIKALYGIELEVDNGRHSDALMEYLEELKELIRLKSDGSLNHGFEIITFPMTLDSHRTLVPYEEMFAKLHADGFTSHENSTCGLHIHIGRTSFGATARSQNPAIGRFIWIFEAFRSKIKTFSRRKEYRYCEFYEYSSTTSPKQMLTYARQDNRDSRYKVVNLLNAGTIEIRVFKGSLKKMTFLAALELCDYTRKYVTEINKDDSKYTPALTWEIFVSTIKSSEYPNLKEYLVHKRLI